MNAKSSKVRFEVQTDIQKIAKLNRAAFGQPGEADLVDELRTQGALTISLVAEVEELVVGHIAFSPMQVEQQPQPGKALGLGPMAVAPAFQRQGVGMEMLLAGLDACRDFGADIVLVLGHPDFYSKVGFAPASRFGLQCEFPAPDEAFMALELVDGKLNHYSGVAYYHPAFRKVT
jgi:putative acetyltransferase